MFSCSFFCVYVCPVFSCSLPIVDDGSLSVVGTSSRYHSNCLTCTVCSERIDSYDEMDLSEDRSKWRCKKHRQRKVRDRITTTKTTQETPPLEVTTPTGMIDHPDGTCPQCLKALSRSSRRIQLGDKDRKIEFHASCQYCATCRTPFTSMNLGAFLIDPKTHKIYCSKHMTQHEEE